ncbi:MAG: hypothetical protein LBV21_02010 [Candidatus Adiutrix sp.]|jgi:DNA-directed RNA polymerase subunit RPC12/RpoP|nr:hypothetical protein [Candidatus Adiutrix sp.]
MAVTMCPGQNTAFWRPGDIFQIICPACGAEVEFFKDDARRRCPGCGYIFANPRLSEGCAKWCQFADKCLGLNPEIRRELAPESAMLHLSDGVEMENPDNKLRKGTQV